MASPSKGLYYRCYFTKDDRIVGYVNIFAENDDEAIDQSRKILSAARYLSVELWRGTECVATLEKEAPETSDRDLVAH